MRTAVFSLCVAVTLSGVSNAAQIQGEYLESRSCAVYTGPCFANAEMDLAGKEAVMAWKVEKGAWNDTDLKGLGVALILNAEGTLGHDGVFDMNAGKIKSVILVDKKATAKQREALVAFVRASAKDLTGDVVRVEATSIQLENDHINGVGRFSAGKLASIETRALKADDCVCTNEVVYYQPLTKVKDFSPAYSKTVSFQGDGLNNRWTIHNTRSAFLATFRK